MNKEEKMEEKNAIKIGEVVFINKTPHDVTIVGEDGKTIITFPKSDNPFRLEEETISLGKIGDIPITETIMKTEGDLPKKKIGVFYIVSRAVQEAYPDRIDLFIPNESVRDKDGRIIGCRSLGFNHTGY